jgi:hypothetical protein
LSIDRAFASVHPSMHTAETPAPRTLIGIKITYDDDMSNLISRHFFEGHTVVHGPHRLDGSPRLQISIDAIILNILMGEHITNHHHITVHASNRFSTV